MKTDERAENKHLIFQDYSVNFEYVVGLPIWVAYTCIQ